MDSIMAEKFQAMNKYRKSEFLYYLLLHSLAGLTCRLFFSNLFWFPSLCSSMKHFFLISLPCIWSSFFNPKCLFIVVNVIIIFLVGESRLVGPNASSARDICNEYMERSRSLREVSLPLVSTPQEKIRQPQEKRLEEVEKEAELKDVVINTVEDKEVNSKEEDEELVDMKEVKLGGKEEKEVITSEPKEAKQEDRVMEETSEIVEEEAYEEKEREIVEELPAEELNRRVEEFIARVNKQRWLEAHLLVCCKA